jgi:spermidine synthase
MVVSRAGEPLWGLAEYSTPWAGDASSPRRVIVVESGPPVGDDEGPRVGEDEGRRALLMHGVVQSVAPEDAVGGYWVAMLPDVRPRRALVLGLGGGTIVHLLRRRFGEVSVVGVEADAKVLELARAEFGLELPGLEAVAGDAFEFVATCRERFDYICVDLYRGERFQRAVLGRPFLRGLEALATPGAEIYFNLYLDRRLPASVERIGRVLRVRSREQVGENVVVRAGVR